MYLFSPETHGHMLGEIALVIEGNNTAAEVLATNDEGALAEGARASIELSGLYLSTSILQNVTAFSNLNSL